MKITAIKAQVKRAGRYSIFVDEKYTFSLSERGLLEAKLTIDQEITTEQLEAYKQLSSADKLYDAVLNYLALRVRSRWEVETYLKRKGAPALLSEQTINKLVEQKLLNDADFARRWVENRRLLKPTSRRKLALELASKHVPHEVIDEVLSEQPDTDESALQDLVARKRKQSKYQDPQKLMQYLARQGFHYEDIKRALET